jgi:tRNA nucleotidyltransferase/poly(A) polymerase
MHWTPNIPAMQALIEAMLDEVNPVYVVGGVVRDALLGKEEKQTDLDLVIEQDALPVARRVADRLGWAYYPLDETRDVARLVFTATRGEPYVCDIASIRGASIKDDLRVRDFTINAMAFAIRKAGQAELVDVTGGQADLEAGVLRRAAPMSLAEDPLRLLRAVRFLVQFDLSLDPETREQIRRLAATIKLASPERLRDELWKALTLPHPAKVITTIDSLGLLANILPELSATIGVEQSFPHYTDVYDHTLGVMDRAAEIRAWLQAPAPGPPTTMWQTVLAPWRTQLRQHFLQPMAGGRQRLDWLIWHALFHDVGKPATRTQELQPDGSVRYRFFGHEEVSAHMAAERLEFLRFSRGEIDLCRTVVAAHMRPHHLDASFQGGEVSRRAMYRFFRDVNAGQPRRLDGVDVLMLAVADYQAIYEAAVPPRWDEYLEHVARMLEYAFSEDGWRRTQTAPLVDGHILMQALDLPPGPEIGALLKVILEAQAAGEIATQEEALALAKRRVEDKIEGIED